MSKSAEYKAIARLGDEEDESKWIAVVKEGEEIDIESHLDYLSGFKLSALLNMILLMKWQKRGVLSFPSLNC